jgi:hypothetical protein
MRVLERRGWGVGGVGGGGGEAPLAPRSGLVAPHEVPKWGATCAPPPAPACRLRCRAVPLGVCSVVVGFARGGREIDAGPIAEAAKGRGKRDMGESEGETWERVKELPKEQRSATTSAAVEARALIHMHCNKRLLRPHKNTCASISQAAASLLAASFSLAALVAARLFGILRRFLHCCAGCPPNPWPLALAYGVW